MSDENGPRPKERLSDVIVLIWGLAPALLFILGVVFISMMGPTARFVIPMALIVALVSQFAWSAHMVSTRAIPSNAVALDTVLLTLVGLFVNVVIVFGGCACIVGGALG